MLERSQLFVPGNRPDRFEKACSAGADLVCIDLEDAVSQTDKATARDGAMTWLAQTPHNHVGIRINGVDTSEGKADIQALAQSALSLPFIMIPKVNSAQDIAALDAAIPTLKGSFFVIIESALGLLNVADIFAHPRVTRALFGAVDYAADVNCDIAWESLLYARSHLANAAAAYNVTLFDVPHIHVRDLEDCETTTRRAKALGIHARSAIHPAQIARIHTALAPTEADIKDAERVIAAYQVSDGNVVLIDGKLIEAPIIKRAEHIIAWGKDR